MNKLNFLKKNKERKGQKKEKEKSPCEKRKNHANYYHYDNSLNGARLAKMPPPLRGDGGITAHNLPLKSYVEFRYV